MAHDLLLYAFPCCGSMCRICLTYLFLGLLKVVSCLQHIQLNVSVVIVSDMFPGA